MAFTLGLDLDGPVRNWLVGTCTTWEKLTGQRVDPHNTTTYRLEAFFDASLGDVYDMAFKTHPQEVSNAAPDREGARAALKRLRKDGMIVTIITSQPSLVTKRAARAWLALYKIPYDAIVFTSEKAGVDCDLYVDDSPAVIQQYQDNNRPFIIWRTVYNRNIRGDSANNWIDLERMIRLKMVEKELVHAR